jgi:hypothetical protein
MIAEPEPGDRIMRALILRRVALIKTGAGGPVLIGPEDGPDIVRLQGFLTRNAYPYQVLAATDRDAADLVVKYAPGPMDLPLAVCPKGTILNNPSEAELARALGMVRIDEPAAPTMSPSWAPDRRVSRPQSTRRLRDFRLWCLTHGHSADKPEQVPVSRTTWDFPPAYPARH